jgi:hypothetical protein
MGACPTQNFTGVTDAVWKCLVATAAKHDIKITADKGKKSMLGVTVTWTYDRQAQTLKLESSSSFVGCSTIVGQMQKMVGACLAKPAA